MERDYNCKTEELESLTGKKVISAEIDTDLDIIRLKTTEGDFFLNFTGDCCAHCFVAQVNGIENLIDATITKVETTQWETISEEEYGDVVEEMGATIRTNKGVTTFETRVNHNGYYGGSVNVSKDYPVDNYHCGIEVKDCNFKPLKDF